MQSSVEVTVCVATFNHSRYISRCLQSVVSQLPFGRLEVLVGDDGSSDGTRKIVAAYAAAYPGIVVPMFHEQRLGPSGNYRALIAAARGRYIAHLDGDDYWVAGKIERQIEVLDQSKHAPAVLTNALVVDADDTPLGFFTSRAKEHVDLDYLVARGNFLCHGSLLYRAELKDEILGIPGEFIDYMILVRLASRGGLAFIRDPLVVYRWNSTGSMRATMASLVGANYWQALLDAFRLGASAHAFRGGAIRLLEKIFAACVAQGSVRPMLEWMRRVRRESPIPSGGLLLIAVLRMPVALTRHLRRLVGKYLFCRISSFYPR